MTILIFANYNNVRNISFSRSLLYDTDMNFFNAGLIFTPEDFILCKKVWSLRGPVIESCESCYTPSKFHNDITSYF